MDQHNYLQYLNDDDQLFQAENLLFRESFPPSSIDFSDYFSHITLPSAKDAPCDPESRKTETDQENTTTTTEETNEVDEVSYSVKR